MESKCSNCHKLKPLSREYFGVERGGYRKQCRDCQNANNRTARAAKRLTKTERVEPKPQVDPHLAVMVGAALKMWGGPVNREQPMRWSVAA